jgi:DtxR family Mn-dependent transcriptional regulator
VLEYLQLIYALRAEGADAYAVTLADRFGVSRANASATVQRMVRDGLVHVEGRQIELTEQGRASAEAGLRRHRLTERFLVDVLGIEWATVDAQARRFERGLTPLLEERMDQRLGYPRTCPHGSPIPRADLNAATYLRDRGAVLLAEAPLDRPLLLLLISEAAEDRPEALRACLMQRLLPGARILVGARAADGSLTLQHSDGSTTIDASLAACIWVVRAGQLGQEGKERPDA